MPPRPPSSSTRYGAMSDQRRRRHRAPAGGDRVGGADRRPAAPCAPVAVFRATSVVVAVDRKMASQATTDSAELAIASASSGDAAEVADDRGVGEVVQRLGGDRRRAPESPAARSAGPDRHVASARSGSRRPDMSRSGPISPRRVRLGTREPDPVAAGRFRPAACPAGADPARHRRDRPRLQPARRDHQPAAGLPRAAGSASACPARRSPILAATPVICFGVVSGFAAAPGPARGGGAGAVRRDHRAGGRPARARRRADARCCSPARSWPAAPSRS